MGSNYAGRSRPLRSRGPATLRRTLSSWKRRGLAVPVFVIAAVLLLGWPPGALAATPAETAAVNWAVGQIGNNGYQNLCLSFVQNAYQDGAGLNIQPLTSYGTFNSNTYPQQVWDDGFKSGTTGGSNTTPPYGALVFFNDPSDYEYSHVMIMGNGGEMISTEDAYSDHHGLPSVHYETLAQEQASGAYASYVGWWLPDGSGSSGSLSNGTLVSYAGNVYVIAGGAPLYVSNWAAVGGPQSVTTISQAQFDALPSVPANGTVLDTAAGVDGGGGVYIVAGGAPLYLSTFNAVPGSTVGTTVDYSDIDNAGTNSLSHLNAVPANGTVLDTAAGVDGGGGVYIVAGGAPLYLSTFNAVPGSTVGTTVDYWDIANAGTNSASHLNAVPANGTVLNASNGGGVYIVVGGAPLYLSSYNDVPSAQSTGTAVDYWDIQNAGTNSASHLNAVPASGTFLNTSTGSVYRIAGGAPFLVSNWSIFGGAQPSVTIDQWDINNATNPAAHVRATPANGTAVEGLPSDTYWSFSNGLRSPASSTTTAVAVDDVGLAAYAEASSSGPSPSQGNGSITPAGSAATEMCVVPNLRHLTLATARRALKHAHCRLGSVRREKRKARQARVIHQSAVRGSKHRNGYKINVTLS